MAVVWLNTTAKADDVVWLENIEVRLNLFVCGFAIGWLFSLFVFVFVFYMWVCMYVCCWICVHMLTKCHTDRCCSSTSSSCCNFLHQFLLGAFRTDDVLFVGNETAADQWRFADGADEAIVVPVTVLERDEAGTADSCEWKWLSRLIPG